MENTAVTAVKILDVVAVIVDIVISDTVVCAVALNNHIEGVIELCIARNRATNKQAWCQC